MLKQMDEQADEMETPAQAPLYYSVDPRGLLFRVDPIPGSNGRLRSTYIATPGPEELLGWLADVDRAYLYFSGLSAGFREGYRAGLERRNLLMVAAAAAGVSLYWIRRWTGLSPSHVRAILFQHGLPTWKIKEIARWVKNQAKPPAYLANFSGKT